jgi:hypothetical protein
MPDIRSGLRSAAVSIIERDGIGSLSMRSLGREAHYSASAVHHQIAPMESFLTEVWSVVHQSSAVRITAWAATTSDWASSAAREWARWGAEHPQLASFYCRHVPDRAVLRCDAETCGVTAEQWTAGGSAISDAWYSCLRRMQAALELCWRSHEPRAVEILADDLRSITRDWRRIVNRVVPA